MFSDRKASYKVPPASVRERAVSQDLRRKKVRRRPEYGTFTDTRFKDVGRAETGKIIVMSSMSFLTEHVFSGEQNDLIQPGS